MENYKEVYHINLKKVNFVNLKTRGLHWSSWSDRLNAAARAFADGGGSSITSLLRSPSPLLNSPHRRPSLPLALRSPPLSAARPVQATAHLAAAGELLYWPLHSEPATSLLSLPSVTGSLPPFQLLFMCHYVMRMSGSRENAYE